MKSGYPLNVTFIHSSRKGLTVSIPLFKCRRTGILGILSSYYCSLFLFIWGADLDKEKEEALPSPFDSNHSPKDFLPGKRSKKGVIRKDVEEINCSVNFGEVFSKKRVGDRKESIALRPNDKRKFVRIALDKGQEPSPYRVPGNALAFLLEAVAVVTDERV